MSLLTPITVTLPRSQAILDELRKQHPNAPIPATVAEARPWLDREIDEMLSDEANTKSQYNRQYTTDLWNAVIAIDEAQRYEPVGEEVGASV